MFLNIFISSSSVEYEIGQRVEVMGHEGFQDSYYEAKIISKDFKGDYEVKYETLMGSDNSRKGLK